MTPVVFDAPNVKNLYGAKGNGTDDTIPILKAIADAEAYGDDVVFSPGIYSYSQTLDLTDGIRLVGQGTPQRWRSSFSPVKLVYTGTGAAVRIANPASGTRESVEIHGIRFDGTGLAGNVDGLQIDGTAGGLTNYVEGVYLHRCAFTNFPRYQTLIDGLVIDVTADHCGFNNVGVPSSHDLVRVNQTKAGAVVTQLTWQECLLAQYGANAWCYRSAAENERFVGGTITTNGDLGASGIWSGGALTIFGTHLEGSGRAAGSIGVRWSSAQPMIFSPSYCTAWDDGLQIGDPTSRAARANGGVVNGMLAGNNTDLRVAWGGSRVGTVVLSTGQGQGAPPIVVNERLTIDGEHELLRLDLLPPAVTGSRGGNAAVASLLTQLAARGYIVDSTT